MESVASYRRSGMQAISAALAPGPVGAGGSRPFLVIGSNGLRYWCKPPTNGQNRLVPVAERVAGQIGNRLGVAVCDVELVDLSLIAGTRLADGREVPNEIAHGSREVEKTLEQRHASHMDDDDNASRFAGFLVLCNLLGGTDHQWLTVQAEDNAYYSHDHGHYFGGPDWTPENLRTRRNADLVDIPNVARNQIDPAALSNILGELENLEDQSIVEIIAGVPGEWPISDEELDALANYVACRRDLVIKGLQN